MSTTRFLLTKAAHTFWSEPRCWIPALLAAALDYVFGFACKHFQRPMIMALAPRSVLGGTDVRLTPAILFCGAILTWVPILFEAASFVYAIGATARTEQRLHERGRGVDLCVPGRRFIPTWFWTTLGSLIAIAVAVGLGTVISQPRSVLWFYGLALPAAAWFLIPVWLGYISNNGGPALTSISRSSRYFGFCVGAVGAAALNILVSQVEQTALRDVRGSSLLIEFVLGLVGRCVSVLPLVVAFLALSETESEVEGT